MNFACVCYGIKYKLEYVQKLYNMVQRHTTIPHKFYCFTDHVNPQQQLIGDVIIKQFPMFNLQGWWNKMQLFHPGVIEGTTLYMDLDVVITDNIDCFFNYEPEAMKDKLWQPFINDRERWLRYSGDQNVISEVIMKHPETRSFPDSWTQSYKWHDRKGERYHKGKWTFEHNGESLVTVFHGQPNPHESNMEWVKKAWI